MTVSARLPLLAVFAGLLLTLASPAPGQEPGEPKDDDSAAAVLQQIVGQAGGTSPAAPPRTFWQKTLNFLFRLAAAFFLGLAVALHPFRYPRMMKTPEGRSALHAQILIGVGGCLMVLVVEDSAARAFGLLGLGSFVRFRTAVKDPVETVLMFFAIGLGMAAGLELYDLAITSAAFCFAILFFVARPTSSAAERGFTLTVEGTSADAISRLRVFLQQNGAVIRRSTYKVKSSKARLSGFLPLDLDPDALSPEVRNLAGGDCSEVDWRLDTEAD